MYKVSVVVPVYNCKEYLKQNIDGLLKQTLSDIEIIIVDDGSTDGSTKICDDYVNEKRVVIVHQENGGVSKARNTGLECAKGEYVIFVDGDDHVPNDAYEKMYNNAVEHSADIVIGDIFQVFDKRRKYVKFYNKEIVTSDQNEIQKLIQADIYKGYCPYPVDGKPAFGYGGPWNKLVKRSLLVESNIKFDERLRNGFEDILYTAYILAECKIVSYFSCPVYEYRILNNSLTHSYKSNVLDINSQIFECWNEFFSKYSNKDFDGPFYACVIRRYTEMMGLYICNPRNKMTFFEEVKFARGVMDIEPYRTSANKVDSSKLGILHNIMAFTIRRKAAILSCSMYYFIVFIKRVLKY